MAVPLDNRPPLLEVNDRDPMPEQLDLLENPLKLTESYLWKWRRGPQGRYVRSVYDPDQDRWQVTIVRQAAPVEVHQAAFSQADLTSVRSFEIQLLTDTGARPAVNAHQLTPGKDGGWIMKFTCPVCGGFVLPMPDPASWKEQLTADVSVYMRYFMLCLAERFEGACPGCAAAKVRSEGIAVGQLDRVVWFDPETADWHVCLPLPGGGSMSLPMQKPAWTEDQALLEEVIRSNDQLETP